MSKFWRKTTVADYSELFGGKWSPDLSAAPHDGSTFLGRLRGTNRSFAVRWDANTNAFHRVGAGWEPHNAQVDLIEWISFRDFADTRHCVWNGGGRECFLPSKAE